MAIGPIAFLARAVRAVYSGIRLGVRLGVSTPRILAAVGRAAGEGFRSQTTRVIAAERAAQDRAARVLGTPSRDIIDPAGIPGSLTKMRRQYAWRVRTIYVDPQTGRRIERFVTVSTDDLLSHEDAITEAESMLESEYGITSELQIDTEVVDVRKAAPGQRL